MLRTPHHRIALPKRLSWVLWLALLLPLAQSVASWHVLSHTRADAAQAAGEHAYHGAHCSLCVAAAAVHSGGLPSAAPTLAAPSETQALPRSILGSRWIADPPLAYESRAPPFAQL